MEYRDGDFPERPSLREWVRASSTVTDWIRQADPDSSRRLADSNGPSGKHPLLGTVTIPSNLTRCAASADAIAGTATRSTPPTPHVD